MNKPKLLLKRFVGRTDAYTIAQHNDLQKRDNYYARVFEPLTAEVIQKHLDYEITIAIFPTDPKTQKAKFACWDIDKGELSLPKVLSVCDRMKYDPLIEVTSENRYHVWVLFDKPKSIKDIRKARIECSLAGIDFYPERDVVINDFFYELPIRLPFGVHPVTKEPSRFVNRKMKSIDDDIIWKQL